MSKFDRYMLSELVVLFGFFSLILVSVYWINQAIGLFDDLISNGQNALVFLEFTALTLPNVILVVLPIAGFVAAVYVTNRLSAESEMVVLQTAGAGPFRIGRAVMTFGVFVAILVSILGHVLVPSARSELATRSAEISRDVTARFLKEGQFLHPTSNITVYVGEITDQGELRELFLEDARDDDRTVTYTAQNAVLVRTDAGARLVMFDGLAQTLDRTGRSMSTIGFDDFAYDIGGLVDTGKLRRRDLREISTATLLNPTQADIDGAKGDAADFAFEGHDRFGRALLAFAVPLMGFAALMLGGFSRFGVWRQVVFAIVLIVIVQMIANMMEDKGRDDVANFWMAYVAPVTGIAMACGLLWFAGLGPIKRRAKLPQKAVP